MEATIYYLIFSFLWQKKGVPQSAEHPLLYLFALYSVVINQTAV